MAFRSQRRWSLGPLPFPICSSCSQWLSGSTPRVPCNARLQQLSKLRTTPSFCAPQSSGPAERQRGGLGIGEGLIGPVLRSGILNPPLTSFPAWARARPPIGVLRAPPPVHDTNIVVSMARSGGTREYSLGWIQPPGLGRARPSLEDREPWHEFPPPFKAGSGPWILSPAMAGEQRKPLPEGVRPDEALGRFHLTTPERCWFGLVDNSPVAATKGLGDDFRPTAVAQQSGHHPPLSAA